MMDTYGIDKDELDGDSEEWQEMARNSTGISGGMSTEVQGAAAPHRFRSLSGM
jgi:hypothetical protein